MRFLNRIFRWTQAERSTPLSAGEVGLDHNHDATPIRELYRCALGDNPLACDLESRQEAAVDLMLANETCKARNAWLAIARDHPAQFALALEQVGRCYHLDGDYLSAVENYQAATRVGADSSRLADRIADARNRVPLVG